MKLEKLRITIIEDEPDVREILQATINDSPEMEVVGTADSVESGLELTSRVKTDAIFLDIKIKGGDAFQLINIMKRKGMTIPPIILNTGYNDFEYAQRSLNEFGQDVIMILKKPFWKNWKEKEQNIVDKILERKEANLYSVSENMIKFKSDHVTHIVKFKDLYLVESDTNSKGKGKVLLQTLNGTFSIYEKLHVLSSNLPSSFIRVSRFSIVNSEYILSYNHLDQTLKLSEGEEEIGVGDSFKGDLMDFLTG